MNTLEEKKATVFLRLRFKIMPQSVRDAMADNHSPMPYGPVCPECKAFQVLVFALVPPVAPVVNIAARMYECHHMQKLMMFRFKSNSQCSTGMHVRFYLITKILLTDETRIRGDAFDAVHTNHTRRRSDAVQRVGTPTRVHAGDLLQTTVLLRRHGRRVVLGRLDEVVHSYQ